MQKAGLPAPEYTSVSFMLNATIRNSQTTNDPVNDLTVREANIYKMIASDPRLSIPANAKLLSVSDSAVKRTIRSLKQKHYIVRIGSDKNGKWIILK